MDLAAVEWLYVWVPTCIFMLPVKATTSFIGPHYTSKLANITLNKTYSYYFGAILTLAQFCLVHFW